MFEFMLNSPFLHNIAKAFEICQNYQTAYIDILAHNDIKFNYQIRQVFLCQH